MAQQRGTARAAWALIKLLPAISGRLTAVGVALVVVQGIQPVAFTVWTGVVVSKVAPAVASGGLGTPQGRALLTAVGGLAVIFVVGQVLSPMRQLATVMLARRAELHMRERVMRAVLSPSGIAHLEDPAMLDQVALARAVGPSEATPADVVRGLSALAVQYLSMIGSAVVVGRYWWWLAVLMFGAHVVSRRGLRNELMRILSVMMGQARAMRRANYFRDLILEPGAAKETRVFGMRAWVLERFGEHWHRGMREVWKTRADRRWAIAGIVGVLSGAYVIAVWVLGRAATTTLSPAEVAVLAGAIFGFAEFNLDADLLIVNGSGSIPAALDLERTLTASPEGADPDGMPKRSIRFEDVHFTYPGGGVDVYTGVDLEIPVGKSLAIVGPNGAGKTTLVKLLARLYDPTQGRIVVDGADLRELSAPSWQRRIAAIYQDFVQYQLSAADNVGFGAPEHLGDAAMLADAARRAGAEQIVAGLPDGWDTVLSRQYQGGSDLSGGQWQRIALARALFAVQAGAGVLVLDEPTANLDVRAEAELFDRFLELTHGLTTILISHRFSTVRRADHIVVLEDGRVTEAGTHEDLLALDGTYAHMFRLQAARFVDDVADEMVVEP